MMDEEQAVLGLNRAFYRAFEKKDLDTMSNLWSHGSASLCIHPGRDVLKGWEAIYSSWEKIFRNTSYMEIEPEVIRVEINGNLAYVVLIENVLQVAGNRRIKARSMATNIFECMGERWYLIHHHGSPLIN